MRLYLGTHEPPWIGRSTVPLFVSASRSPYRWPRRPALAGWACDSGAFTEITRFGRHRRSVLEHAELVATYAERCPGLEWAAPQDWMCEPIALARTGLSIAEHQERTVTNLLELRAVAPAIHWVPVLQGFELDDYVRCAKLYADAEVDLRGEARVGLGSICRRQATTEIAALVRTLAAEGLALHGFGVKVSGLRLYGRWLASADSMAWSYRARRHGRPLCGGQHAACSNCFVWAHHWHELVTRSTKGLA